MMNKIKILYVDSQKEYSKKYLSYLIENEYDVKYISSLKDALIEHSFHKPDLIITDIELEDGSGLELIKKIKKYNNNIRSFVLTENVDRDTLLETIPLKIDKFFFKVQNFTEIDKEIKKLNIIKEPDFEDEKDILFDLGENFLYEKNSFHIIKNDNLIALTYQENLLISQLVKAKGECVSYEILQAAIGKDTEATIETLRTVIKKIRRKTYNGIIKNQSGIGYKITFHPPIDTKNDFIIEHGKLDLKILILKVNKKRSELLSYQLSKFGFCCESVNTIAQAKELLEEEKFDYIVSDLNLPDGESIDLIRDMEDLNSTKMIILSSTKDIHYKDYLYFKGILDYVLDIEDTKHLSYTLYKTIQKVEKNTKFNNILVIEQSKRICEQIKDLLLPRNYNVDILNEIGQAYELIKTKTYSLIVLDIEYEKSFDFIVDIKCNVDKSLPFIILSDTNRTYPTVREAYKSGASECLRKPIYAEEFILKVDQLVEHSKLVFELMEQKELTESYQKIVDQSAIISKTDPKGKITYVNDMFTKISGYLEDELLGKAHSIIRHPDTPRELFHDMWKTIKEDKKIWCGIIKNKKKNGEEYIVQTSIMPLKDSDGNIMEYIALRNDITSVFNK